MDDKDTNSKEKSVSESIEAQFDDLFAPKKPDAVPDSEKKPSDSDTPPAKKVLKKVTHPKPLNKKVTPPKAPVPKKHSSASGKPSDKEDHQKFKPNKTLFEKKTQPVPEPESKPRAEEDSDVPVTKKEVKETVDTGKTAVENVFKKANQEFNKNVLWEKFKQGLNPLIFSLLILLLILLSILNGMMMDSDGILEFLNIKDTPTSALMPLTVKHKNKRKVSVHKVINTPVPEEDIAEAKIEKPDTQMPDINEEKALPVSTSPLPLVENDDNSDDVTNDVVKEEFISYPYSVYLGSYNSVEKVKTASADYRSKGITSYWIKIDLGTKGVWYRHFVGYFRTRNEADAFIKARQIKEAESRVTKYAILIGVYRSKEEIERQKTRLEELGYSVYIISDSENVYRLYAGAFYQEGRAEEFKGDLAANGIKSKIVER